MPVRIFVRIKALNSWRARRQADRRLLPGLKLEQRTVGLSPKNRGFPGKVCSGDQRGVVPSRRGGVFLGQIQLYSIRATR